MSIFNLTPTQLREAADLQDKIAKLETELAAILGEGSKSAPAVANPAKPAKRKMSAAHIAKIRAAQKLRWAKFHAAKPTPAPKAVKPPKKKISAEGIARIKAAQKARWAKIKAEKAAK